MTETTECRFPERCGCGSCVALFVLEKQLQRDTALWSLIQAAVDDMTAAETERTLTLSRALAVLSRLNQGPDGGFLNEWAEGFCEDLGGSEERDWTHRQREVAARTVKTFDDKLREAGYEFAPAVERLFAEVRRYPRSGRR